MMDAERVRLIAQMTTQIYAARAAVKQPSVAEQPVWMRNAQRDAVRLLMLVDKEGVYAPEGAPIRGA